MTMGARSYVRETPGARDDLRVRQSTRSGTGPTVAIRFPLGRIVATRGAVEALARASADPVRYVARHACGDWGELDADDWSANERALREGARLLSAYRLPTGDRLWIITEADRTATTLLLPEEY
jgi:hypothetical protein